MALFETCFLFIEKYALEDIQFFQLPIFDAPFFFLSDLVKWIRQSTSSKQIVMLVKIKKLPNSNQHLLKLPSQGSEPQYFILKFVVCFLIWSPKSIKETDKIYLDCVKMASSMRFESGDKKKQLKKKKKSGWFKETFLVQSDFLSFTHHVGETPPS